MAAPRSQPRSFSNRTSKNQPSSQGNGTYSAKKKASRAKQFLPLWFLFIMFVLLAVVLIVDRKKRLVWEKMIKNYLEPPPIGIKLTDKGKFDREALEKKDTDHEANTGAGKPTFISDLLPASPHHDDDPSLVNDHLGVSMHIVFSTDCSPYQHWQSYLLFFSSLRSKQPGTVTRIASGCSESEAAYEQSWFNEHISTMSRRFHLHFTPNFSNVKVDGQSKGGDYKYFNKPFGLRHWIEHSPLMGLNDNGEVKGPDEAIVLLDPDMIILRPITTDFSSDRDVIIPKRVLKYRKTRLEKGVPFGQAYGMGAKWKDFDLDLIIGKGVPSPARDLPKMEGLLRYAVGPPYLAFARDMYAIAVKWTEFVPGVYAQYPKLLAEMYGYCIAAAHKKLPHQKVEHLMVSDTTLNCEGWDFVEALPDGEVCSSAVKLDHAKHPLPNVFHYCQHYALGEHSFHKKKVSHSFFSCEGDDQKRGITGFVPMMSADADLHYNSTKRMRKNVYKDIELSRGEVKREVFALCTIQGTLNEALTYYRNHHCDG